MSSFDLSLNTAAERELPAITNDNEAKIFAGINAITNIFSGSIFADDMCQLYKDEMKKLAVAVASQHSTFLDGFIEFDEFTTLFSRLGALFGISGWSGDLSGGVAPAKEDGDIARVMEHLTQLCNQTQTAENATKPTELAELLLAHLRTRMRFNSPTFDQVLFPSYSDILSLVNLWMKEIEQEIEMNKELEKKEAQEQADLRAQTGQSPGQSSEDENGYVYLSQEIVDEFINFLSFTTRMDHQVKQLNKLIETVSDSAYKRPLSRRIHLLEKLYGRPCWFATEENWKQLRADYALLDKKEGIRIDDYYFVHRDL